MSITEPGSGPSPSGREADLYDVVIVTDLRFPGGSSGSTLEEINVQHKAGLRTGLFHISSTTLQRRRTFHPGILKAVLEGRAELLNPEISRPGPPIRSRLTIFRHPSVIDHQDGPLPELETDQVLLVINHPPINAKGRIDYILPYALERLRQTYGNAAALPIGPLVRTAIEKYYPGVDLLAAEDWNNIFDLDRFWARTEFTPRDPIRIGRHSRPNREKWPEKPAEILGAYPDRSDIGVHILGGSDVPEEYLRYRPKNWVVHEFGTRAVEEFLHEIDVFVYFHHPNWVEAFGRVVAEAMATGLPCILPAPFEPLFGEGAVYTTPDKVADIVVSLRDPEVYRERSQAAAAFVREHFSADVHLARLERYGVAIPAPQSLPEAGSGTGPDTDMDTDTDTDTDAGSDPDVGSGFRSAAI